MRKLTALLVALMILATSYAFVAVADENEPWTVTVFAGDPKDQPTSDNRIFKKIEEEFGLKFEFEFLAGDLNETLGIKISGQDYADLMDGSNSAETLISAGALIDLMPYISEENTPNIYTHIKPYLGRLLDEQGRLFIIPNYGRTYNDEIVNYCNGPAFFVQKKVMAWAGYPQIKTLNEYFDLIESYITANPTDENGNPYKGFEILCEDWRAFCLFNPVQHLMGRPNDGDVLVDITTDAYETEAYAVQDYAKIYYKKLNEMFNKGIISQDTFVMNFDQYIAKLSDGTVLGMFDQYWDFQNATNALETAGMWENTYIALPLVYDVEDIGYEIEEHYLNGTVINVNRGFGISVNCEQPERLVSFIEEMLSDRWQTLLVWGEEGIDYYVEDGRYLRNEEQKANAKNQVWRNANTARVLWESMPKKQGTMDNGNSWDPDLQPEIYFDMMSDYDKDFLKQYGYRVPADFFNPPITLAPFGEAWQIDVTVDDAANDAKQGYQDIQRRDLPQIIMAETDEEFDERWDAFVKAAEEVPLSDFVDFMQKTILELVERNS